MGAVSDALNSVVVSLIALAIVVVAFQLLYAVKFGSWGVITSITITIMIIIIIIILIIIIIIIIITMV